MSGISSVREHEHERPRRSLLLRFLPVVWLALSAVWVVVVIVTDRPAWPLAIWIAITIVPVTATERRQRRRADRSPN